MLLGGRDPLFDKLSFLIFFAGMFSNTNAFSFPNIGDVLDIAQPQFSSSHCKLQK